MCDLLHILDNWTTAGHTGTPAKRGTLYMYSQGSDHTPGGCTRVLEGAKSSTDSEKCIQFTTCPIQFIESLRVV